ncbi:MAG: PIN domain-containing protein [Chthoniobacteraceae bacterium]
MICADTSFLLSYYGEDSLSERARAHRTTATLPLSIHAFNEFEFANALRLLVYRGKALPQQRQAWLASYEADKISGLLAAIEFDANAVIRVAETISAARTATSGDRSYDILLIAAAKLLGATEFWSFDSRQRDLATAEGLIVGP